MLMIFSTYVTEIKEEKHTHGWKERKHQSVYNVYLTVIKNYQIVENKKLAI